MINSEFFHDIPVQIRLSGGGSPAAEDFEIIKIWNRDKLRVSVKNVSASAVGIKEIALCAGKAPLPAETEFYGEGYHMLSQYRGNMISSRVIGAYGSDKDFFYLPDNPHDVDLHITYYLLELALKDGYTLLAFASCRKFLGKFRFKENCSGKVI